MTKTTVVSAIQPSGEIGVGHYIGAIKNWLALQHEHECWFAVADLHAITIPQSPKLLRERSFNTAAYYIAAGVDPNLAHIFIQSQVASHSEFAWILSTLSTMGELSRMTQYKDKSSKQNKSIPLSLFAYPTLMAADILLYDADFVPVGEDQKQHLELTRDLAIRFNNQFKSILKVPEPMINKLGARLMSLQDPSKKMSKSDDNVQNFLAFSDPKDVLVKKIKRAVTDSERTIEYDVSRPGISNLLVLFSSLSGKSIESLVAEYYDAGYAVFKSDLAECVVNTIVPIQERFLELKNEKQYILNILDEGQHKAEERTRKVMDKVHFAMGLY